MNLLKKILLAFILSINMSSSTLPLYAYDTYQDTQVVEDYRTYNATADVIKGILFLLAIGLILIILISPIIIWNLIYENISYDSGLKHVMHIANILMIILTLGLICLHKKR